MRRLLVAVAVVLLAAVVLVVVMAVKAARFTSRQVAAVPAAPFAAAPGAPQRLAAASAIPTISYGEPAPRDTPAFAQLREPPARTFPPAHATTPPDALDHRALP